MSYQTRVTYVVTGGQREFDLAIPYIDKTHIKVTLNGSFTAFEWISDSRIRLTYLPVENSTLKVRRETPISAALVEFQNGATLGVVDASASPSSPGDAADGMFQ